MNTNSIPEKNYRLIPYLFILAFFLSSSRIYPTVYISGNHYYSLQTNKTELVYFAIHKYQKELSNLSFTHGEAARAQYAAAFNYSPVFNFSLLNKISLFIFNRSILHRISHIGIIPEHPLILITTLLKSYGKSEKKSHEGFVVS